MKAKPSVLLTNNFFLKIISIIIAVLLWFYVMDMQNPQETKELKIPLKLINEEVILSRGLTLNEDKILFANIKVKGRGEFIRGITQKDIEALVDLKECNKEGDFTIPINYNITGYSGIEIINSSQNNITLNIEKLLQVKKSIDIIVKEQDKNDARFVIKSYSPKTLTIGGKRSLLESINSVKAIVDTSNIDKDYTANKKYRIYNKENVDITNLKGIIKDLNDIKIDLLYFKEKQVSIVPDIITNLQRGYEVSTVTAIPDTIKIYGEPKKIANINYIKTEKIKVDDNTKTVNNKYKIILPEGIKTDDEKLSLINANIYKIGEKTINVDESKINIINRFDDYNYRISQNYISVQLKGDVIILNTLNSENIKFFVDVNKLSKGKYQLAVSNGGEMTYRIINAPLVEVNIN